MKIYGLKNCDTCRKAQKALGTAQFIDVRDDGIPTQVMQSAYESLGEKLLNTRSTTWRELPPDERKRPTISLLNDHPALMKRPLIEVGGVFYLGWTPEVQAALVGV